MKPVRLLIVAAALVGLCSPWAEGQDKVKEKEPAAKLRGQLPPNWGKLGLDDAQRQRIYKIQADYREKIDALQSQLDALRDRQRRDMEGILTGAQKARLRDILAGKAPVDK
jgi:hypothetical protein